MKTFTLYIFLLVLVFTSCKKELPTVGGTAAQPIANEWWVTVSLGGVDQLGTHVKLATYNTSANNNEIWVDDLKNIWPFKVKAQANFSSLTFKASAAKSEYSP